MTVDDRALQKVRDRVDGVAGKAVRVGIFAGSGSDGQMVDLAMTHEYGSRPGKLPVVPERSFLRSTRENQRERIAAAIGKASERLVEGKITPDQALNGIGEFVVAEVRKTMTGPHIPPPIAESTVARRKKKTRRPLVDNGQLLKSITHVVGRKGSL